MIATLLGALAFAAAFLGNGIGAAMAWSIALFFACFGLGIAVERVARLRQALGTTIACGLVALCAGSLALGYLGCLVAPVQLALVGAGILACALPRPRAPTRVQPPPLSFVVAIAAGLALVMIAGLLRDIPVSDDMNHVFVVKRLADTGRLVGAHHGAGLQIIAESYWALARGARDAAVFEQGGAVALVMLLLAELARSRQPMFAALVLGVFAAHSLVDVWSEIALLLAAYLALARALEARRIGGQAILLAVGLALTRHELVLLAFPIGLVALAMPRRELPSRRAVQVGLVAWLAVAIPLQIALAVHVAHATLVALALIGCVPAAMLLLRLASVRTFRSPIAPLVCGALLLEAAWFLGGIRVAQHASSATLAIWLAIAFVLVAEAERIVAIAVTAMLVVCGAWIPNWTAEERERIGKRVEAAVDVLARGWTPDEPDLRELQRAAPARARLGFWGKSADELDFTRNPIRDVSFPRASRRNRDYLMQLSAASLASLEYVIVENVPPSELLDPVVADPWGTNMTAIDSVRNRLTVIATNGHGGLYRIARR